MGKFTDGVMNLLGRTALEDRNGDYDYEDVLEDEAYFDDEGDYVEESAERRSPRVLSSFFRNDRRERTTATYERAEEHDGYGYESSAAKPSPVRIVLVKPRRFSEVKRIADNLTQSRSVIFNFEEMSKEESQRTMDFLSGATYARDGKVEKVSNCSVIFAVGPVDLVGRIKEVKGSENYFTGDY